jgi:uncharacterized protein YkwD
MRRTGAGATGVLVSVLSLLTSASASSSASGEEWVWKRTSASPRAVAPGTLSDREADLVDVCGRGEEGLHDVAVAMVARKLLGLPDLEGDELSQRQRVAGEPHVWPRGLTISGRALDHEATRAKVRAWGAGSPRADRRCGVAIGYGPDGTEVVAVVAVNAAAELAPLPTESHVGAWLAIDAKLLVPATGGRVLVSGPSGRPRTLPTELAGSHLLARFAPDAPGAFTVQVVADVETGPRPVLEAIVFADAAPWAGPPAMAAPGETAALPSDDDHAAVVAMVDGLRASARLPSFAVDARLDRVALAHAQQMKRAHSVAHDLGDGDPVARIGAAGLHPRVCGENVAHAETLALAHRALYASPSHRANLLSSSFDRIGVGVVRDADGSVWVTEELAGR